MRRIKRLLSFAMAGALMLCTTLSEALASDSPGSVNTTAAAASNASGGNKAAPKAIPFKTEETAKKKESSEKKESTEKKEKSEKKESTEKKEKSKKKESTEKKEKSEKEVRLTLSIASPDGLSKADGAYQVDPEQVKTLKLAWSCKGDCDSYEVSVSGGVYSDTTRKTSLKLSVGNLAAGKYTVTVKAIRDGKTAAKQKLIFQVVKSEKSTDDANAEAAPSEPVASDAQETPEADIVEAVEESEAAQVEDAGQDTQETEAAQVEEAAQDTQESETASAGNTEQESQESEAATTEDATTEDAEQDQQESEAASTENTEQESQESDATTIEDTAQDQQDTEKASTENAEQDQQEPETVPADDTAQDTQDTEPATTEDTEQDTQTPEAATVEDAETTEDTAQDSQEPEVVSVEAVAPDAEVTADVLEEATVPDAQDAPALSEQASVPDDSAASDVPEEIAGLETTDSFQLSNGDETRETRLTLSIVGMEGLSIADGAYRVDPTQASALKLTWACDGDCDGYRVVVSRGAYDAETSDTSLSLPLSGLADGSYTATVTALKGGKTAASASLSFEIATPEADPGESAELSMTVAAPQGLNITDGAYQVDPTQVDALTLAWEYGGDCDAFRVSVSGGVYSDTLRETSLTIPLDGLAAGRYTAAVSAIVNDAEVAEVQLAFDILQPGQADELTLSITDPRGLSPVDGVYEIDTTKVKSLTFSWQYAAECDRYQVEVSGGVYSDETTDTALTLALDKLAAGQYTLTVSAIKDDEAVAQGQLAFKLSDGQSGDQKPGDGMPKGGIAQGGAAEAEQGFHVTPGEALVSTHTSGSRDMTLYGTVALTLEEGAEMTELTLGGTPLGVMLDGGAKAFTASIDGGTLTLTANDGGTWTLNGRTLKVLSSSGIDVLALHAGGSSAELSTARTMQGAVYARLSSAGIVSADYDYQIDDAGIRIAVAGSAYRLDDTGALIPMEGDGIAEKMV